jgi:hypothetical protein
MRAYRKYTHTTKKIKEFRANERSDCDDGEPPRDPVTAPAAEKEVESLLDNFGNTLESTTGLKLTGAALVTASIISEASRLIPARNAVPVP